MSLNHLGGSGPNGDPITFTPDIFGYVMLKYRLTSVIDIGCALGFNAKWLLDRGYDVMGVEGFPEYVAGNKLPKDRVIQHDYTHGPLSINWTFDLAICTEFVEHVEERFIPNFVMTFKRCRYVLLSHALPGQGGHHHVTEKSPEFWIDVMREAGFYHQEDESQLFQSTFQEKDRYGRNTLMLFQRV